MSSVRTSPPAAPLRRIITSTARTRTEPAPCVFLRSSKRPDNVDDFNDRREKKHTQEEQDAEDEKARKEAMKNLVSSWQERLQLISVITTFFATTEAAMLVNSKPGAEDLNNIVLQVSNATLLGALILHVYASVLSFLGAFLLISYKLREAAREEMIVEGISLVESPLTRSVIKDVERDPIDLGIQRTLTTSKDSQSVRHNSVNYGTPTSVPEQNKTNSLIPVEPPIFSANPHIEQVVPFVSSGSTHQLLSRTHAICVFLAALGFVFALVGIICYSWALQPNAVSIFASACLGGALLTMFALRI